MSFILCTLEWKITRFFYIRHGPDTPELNLFLSKKNWYAIIYARSIEKPWFFIFDLVRVDRTDSGFNQLHPNIIFVLYSVHARPKKTRGFLYSIRSGHPDLILFFKKKPLCYNIFCDIVHPSLIYLNNSNPSYFFSRVK